MPRAENMLRQIVELFIKPLESIPESRMGEIRKMYAKLPAEPRGVAPEWKKKQTVGTNGENTS